MAKNLDLGKGEDSINGICSHVQCAEDFGIGYVGAAGKPGKIVQLRVYLNYLAV